MMRISLGLTALALLTMSGTVAGAQTGRCVTAADLSGGIRVSYEDGTVADFRAAAAGTVTVFEAAAPDATEGIVFESRLGLYDLSAVAVADGTEIPGRKLSVRYSVPADELPAPVTGEVWLGTATTELALGGSLTSTSSYAFGFGRHVALGDCTYAVIPVKTTQQFPGGTWGAQQFLYFPDLGIATVVSRQVWGEPEAETYRVMALAPLAP